MAPDELAKAQERMRAVEDQSASEMVHDLTTSNGDNEAVKRALVWVVPRLQVLITTVQDHTTILDKLANGNGAAKTEFKLGPMCFKVSGKDAVNLFIRDLPRLAGLVLIIVLLLDAGDFLDVKELIHMVLPKGGGG